MNLKNHSTKPSAKISTLQLSVYGGGNNSSNQDYAVQVNTNTQIVTQQQVVVGP